MTNDELSISSGMTVGKRILATLLILVGLFWWRTANLYEISTHVNLTSAIFDFYNKNFPEKKIPEKWRARLVEGSRREDDHPRWLNHFYDPVYNRGLTLSNFSWLKSKDWAQDNKSQLALVYQRPSLAQLLGLSNEPLIFTWQKAIELYNDGDSENAFLVLGHVLHLLEDAAVPDHTRNDPHAEGSPYEEFTKNLIPEIDSKKKPVVLEDLGKYFDEVAKYSNENFYSKDKIKTNDYQRPVVDYFEIASDGANYGMKLDGNFNSYHLIRINDQFAWSFKKEGDISYKLVLSDYWSLLSQKAIQYGAGLIDLFFREATQQKQQEIAASLTTDVEAPRNDKNGGKTFAGQLLGAFKDLFSSSGESGFSEVLVVDLKSPNTNSHQDFSRQANSKSPIILNDQNSKPQTDSVKTLASAVGEVGSSGSSVTDTADTTDKSDKTNTMNKTSAAPIICSWQKGDGQSPARQSLIINEINWVGSADNANDEWLELKNISSVGTDISGWQLLSKGGNIKIKFGVSGDAGNKISAGGFVLLTRGKDYKGALRNTDDGLRLYDNQCHLLDEVLADPQWPAGDNAKKFSAERGQDFSWHNGTPNSAGRENSSGINIVGGGVSAPDQGAQGESGAFASSTVNASTTDRTNSIADASKILLSEILFDAEGADNDKEFIELYNPTDKAINLTELTIQHQSASGSLSKKNFENGQQIPARGFFLIWLGADARADLQWSSGSLNNTAATISLLSGTTTIDFIAYNKSQQPFPTTAGQSLERKVYLNVSTELTTSGQCVSASGSGELLGNGCDTDSLNDWEVRQLPNPQNSKSPPEPPTNQQANASSTSVITNSSSSPAELDFLTMVNFYKDPRLILETDPTGSPQAKYLIEFSTDKYPFVPDKFNYGEGWKAIAFYFNQNPEEIVSVTDFINTATVFKNALPIKYEVCGGNSLVQSHWLLLPDSVAKCDVPGGGDGGAYSYSFAYKNLEDKNFLLPIISGPVIGDLSASDYLTVAYYAAEAVNPQDGRYPYFRLAATSTQKFYFQNQTPVHQNPRLTGLINLNFDRSNSRLLIDWPRAADADTLDRLLTYEIRYRDNDSWLDLGTATSAIKFVSPESDLSISVRAKDDFGNYSEPLTVRWSYPKTEFSIFTSLQDVNIGWSRPFGRGEDVCLNADGSNCLSAISVQSIKSEIDFNFNTVVLRLRQNLVSDHSIIRLGIYPDLDGQPDMNQKIAETAIADLYNPDLNQELAFYFSQPVVLTAGATYWLVLSADYSDARGPWRNSWSNVIYGVNDTYLNGIAGYGDIAFCHSEGGLLNKCRFSFGDPTADWWMKIGLAE